MVNVDAPYPTTYSSVNRGLVGRVSRERRERRLPGIATVIAAVPLHTQAFVGALPEVCIRFAPVPKRGFLSMIARYEPEDAYQDSRRVAYSRVKQGWRRNRAFLISRRHCWSS
jgi:hypothetical protein